MLHSTCSALAAIVVSIIAGIIAVGVSAVIIGDALIITVVIPSVVIVVMLEAGIIGSVACCPSVFPDCIPLPAAVGIGVVPLSATVGNSVDMLTQS